MQPKNWVLLKTLVTIIIMLFRLFLYHVIATDVICVGYARGWAALYIINPLCTLILNLYLLLRN